MMLWIDAHLDLASLVVNGDAIEQSPSPGGCVSLPALRAASVRLAFGTIFLEPVRDADERRERGELEAHMYAAGDAESAHAAGVAQLEVYERWERAGLIGIVRCRDDLAVIEDEADDAPLALLILMEGADPIRTPDEVAWWHERGLRAVGLTWALGTRYAGGNAAHGPLSAEGRALVEALDAHRVIHDVSHLADDSFDDVLRLARGPIIASHSNARSLFIEQVQRHLRDDQIRAIGDRGGVIGLNLYTKFLAEGRRATIDDAVLHVEHVCTVLGHRGGVGLGSDMDGGFGCDALPEGLDEPAKLHALTDALRARGWSDDEIADFTHRNWLRLLRDALPA